MIFKEIVHGTQYYRAPTPLPQEWEGDLTTMGDYLIDTVQIRINWRWNERSENEYDFSDVDRLMSLAEKHGKKVIVKFLLECAPQYIFDTYGGTRIGPRGEQLRGGSHGAFYGGWRPCFTNPQVQARAALFVEKVAERYCDRKNVIAWNLWNEIRNKPVEECFCPHCRKAFGQYLQKKFGTIENLNAFYGTAEESFERIALPSTPHGFWDTYEFKLFKGSEGLYENLSFVRKAIEKHDTTRPIMTHVGVAGCLQRHLGDVCHDYRIRRAADYVGTSAGCDSSMQTHEKRTDYLMLNDYMRSVDENYFVHEIYPGLGMFKQYDTPFDMQFKLYAALSCGAKGLVYWQYRAERVGHEGDCAGLVRMDGSPREVTEAVRAFGADLRRHMPYFVGAKAQKSDIAVVFDFRSQLLSEIEDSAGDDFSFGLKRDPLFYYRYAHAGMYRLLFDRDYGVDYVSAEAPERFCDYKVLYFPYYTMLDAKIVPYLETFLRGGGTLLADEGFGMRQPNTWMQPYDIDCKAIFSARLIERRRAADEALEVNGKAVKVGPYKSQYRVEGGEPILRFADGTPAVQRVRAGKGAAYLFGFSAGYSFYQNADNALAERIDGIVAEAGVKKCAYSDVQNGIYEKRLHNGDVQIVFLFNNGQSDARFVAEKAALAVGGKGAATQNEWVVPARSVGYFVTKNKEK